MSTATELEDDLDLGEYSPEGVEKEMADGGRLPVGKYHAQLVAVGDTQATQRGVMQIPLTFQILAGPHAGRRHTERLNDFVNGATEDAKKKSNNRYLLFASRLGFYDTAGGKYRRLKPSFRECVGADCIIEIKHEPKRDNPSVVYANITFGGVYTLTDPKHKDVPRAAAGSVPVPAAGPAEVDTSDL